MPEGRERIFSKSSGIIILKNMADYNLDIIVVPTYDTRLLSIKDISTYNVSPSAPTIEITIPNGFGKAVLPFTINTTNVFNSTSLGITGATDAIIPIPDGVYFLRYSVAPSYVNFVEKSIMRVDQLQEKFDSAFMRLDMMECDRAIKTQAKVTLNSIYFFIQGAVAAANNCAVMEANKLYNQADKMLSNFINGGCNCSGNNYVTNFY
jgi:hypothetical protein